MTGLGNAAQPGSVGFIGDGAASVASVASVASAASASRAFSRVQSTGNTGNSSNFNGSGIANSVGSAAKTVSGKFRAQLDELVEALQVLYLDFLELSRTFLNL